MKNIYLLLIGLIIFSACRDESLDPRPDLEENVGAVTLVELNPDKTFFNNLNPLASEEVEFTLDINGFEVTEVESVDLVLEYTEKDGAVDPFLGIVDSVYAPVNLGTITSFPTTITITGADVATALGKVASDFEIGDTFVLTFPINTADGRRLTVALASDLCNQPAQPSAGGCSVEWNVTCPSELAVEVDYEIVSANLFGVGDETNLDATGTFTLESPTPGQYIWGSYTFGGYQFLYGCCEQTATSSIIRMVDVCNDIELTDDGFACGWNLTVNDVTGPTLDLTVDGGCIGVYNIIFTRTDGEDWPALF